MPNIEVEFPNVLVVEGLQPKGAANLASNHKLVQQIMSEAFKGVVDKDGKWGMTSGGEILSPGPHWTIEKLETGKYKVTHAQGYLNVALSVTVFQNPGTINVLENHPLYFTVQTSIEGVNYDMPWAFTLVKVISPPSSPQKPTAQNSFSPPT